MDAKQCMLLLKSPDAESQREGSFQAGELKLEEALPLLVGLLKSGNLGVQEAADQALRAIGGKAVIQATIPLLREDDAPVRNLGMDILRYLSGQDVASLVALMRDQDVDIRIFAADILGSTGNRMAVDVLGEALLKDPEVNVRYQAAVSLGNLALPEAAPFLNKAMGDEEWVQYAVIEALAKIKHSSSVDALVKAMSRTSDLVTSMIIDALGEMANVKAVPLLLRRLESSPTALRNKIVKAVVSILGGKALQLLSQDERENLREYMIVALEDEDVEVQDAAVHGLAFVGGEDASQAVLTLAKGLDADRDQERLAETVRCLAQMGLTEALRKALGSDDAAAVRVAVSALAQISDFGVPQALMEAFWKHPLDLQRRIIAALSEVADITAKAFFLDVLDRHGDGKVIKSAAYYLGQRMHAAEAVDRLFGLLEHQYDDVKEAGLDALIAIGTPDVSARFQEFFAGSDPLKRLMAVFAFGKLGLVENIELIRQALEDEVPDIRKVALEAVASMCFETSDWLTLVAGRLRDDSRDVRLSVIEIMGRCYSKDVAPLLLEALNDQDDWVVIRAMDALGGQRERDAVPKVVPLLDHPNRMLALKAVEALGNIGGTAAFRALLDRSESPDPDMQRAVEAALARIQDEHDMGD